MDDCGGFAIIGLLLFYVIGVNMGADPIMGLVFMIITYVSLFGNPLE